MVARLFGLIFGGIGLFFLAIALGFGINTALLISQSTTADGTVIDGGNASGGRKVRALIEFTAATGQTVEFRSAIASNPPEFQTGQKVRVYYKPADPAGSAQVDSFISLWFWSWLFVLLGLVFGGIGLVSLIMWYTGYRRKKWLQQHGQRVKAEITAVKKNTMVHNLGKSPYYVLARSRDTFNSITPTFKSGNVWNLPASVTPGTNIDVLVDPNNYRRYYVELQDAKEQKQGAGGG
jgi:hypothetical protein